MSPTRRSAARPSTLTADNTDDAVWTAQRMALDAGVQAARLRRQASAQTATICEIAEREAETIWQQASARAAAMREAAEREAAELRATVMKLSAAEPVAEPKARPAAPPAIKRPAGKRPAGKRPAGKPSAGKPSAGKASAGKPSAAATDSSPARRRQGPPPRQLVAIRVAAAASAALLLFALAAGVTEVALHGFAFFVFRSAGTGETPGSGRQEDQGPGQPDAPKPVLSHVTIGTERASRL